MRKLLFMAYLLSVVLIQSSLSFDDSRKGFMVGVGLGVQSSKTTSFDIRRGSVDEDFYGKIATSFKIGYGFNDNFLLHYTNDVSFVQFQGINHDTFSVGVTAIGGTYYFNPQAPSAFITAGLGLGTFKNISQSSKEPFTGSGWILGGGYEFSKHINIELSMFNVDLSKDSKLSSRNYARFDIPSTRFTINYLWY